MQTYERPSSHRSSGWPSILETYDNVASTIRRHGVDNVLSRMLPQLSHLDLTGRISNTDATMEAHGGYCDIFVGNVASEHLQHRFAIPTGLVVKVAIKRLRVRLGKDEEFTKSLAREIGVWSRLDHPNILPFLGYLLEKEYPSLISEWIGNGTVRDFLRKYPESDVRHLALGIARGLEYIHEQDVVHSDMKADNVLISQTGEPLICDFGISRMLNSSQTLFVSTTHDGAVKGSTRWMAIELHIPGEGIDPKHSKETDVWAYGMTLYELISKEVPYARLKLDLHVLLAVMKGELPTQPSFVDAQFSLSPLWSICANCWKRDPKARLTVAQIAQELACLEWEQLVQHQTEMIPCQVGQANFGWSSSNEQDIWLLTGMSLPPLTRERFLVMLQDWWRRNGIKPDGRMIAIADRQIDIHQLHTEVLQYGGVVNVRRHELWNVIAEKMGWTPASINEVGRTQDQIAEQFKVVYEQLLESFEVTYRAAAMKQPLTAQPQQTADQQGGPSQLSAGPSQPSGPNQQLSTQQAMHMMKSANMSAEQMRATGYPENFIQNIEQNRPTLQATWHRMQMQLIQAQQQPRPSFTGQQNIGQLPFQKGMFSQKPDEGRATAPQGQQQILARTGLSTVLIPGHVSINESVHQALRNSDGRPLTLDELQVRAIQLRRTIESERKQLSVVPKLTPPEAMIAFREKHREVQSKKILLAMMTKHAMVLTNQRLEGGSQSQQQAQGPLNTANPRIHDRQAEDEG